MGYYIGKDTESILTTIADEKFHVVRITPTITGVQYSNNDILFDTTAIAGAVRVNGGASKLVSCQLVSKSTDVFDMELMFFQVNQSMGTVNAARNVSDADFATAKYLGHLKLDGSANNYNYGNGRIFTFNEIVTGFPKLPIILQAASGSTTVYCAAFLSGDDVTPSFSTGDIELIFGIEL